MPGDIGTTVSDSHHSLRTRKPYHDKGAGKWKEKPIQSSSDCTVGQIIMGSNISFSVFKECVSCFPKYASDFCWEMGHSIWISLTCDNECKLNGCGSRREVHFDSCKLGFAHPCTVGFHLRPSGRICSQHWRQLLQTKPWIWSKIFSGQQFLSNRNTHLHQTDFGDEMLSCFAKKIVWITDRTKRTIPLRPQPRPPSVANNSLQCGYCLKSFIRCFQSSFLPLLGPTIACDHAEMKCEPQSHWV